LKQQNERCPHRLAKDYEINHSCQSDLRSFVTDKLHVDAGGFDRGTQTA